MIDHLDLKRASGAIYRYRLVTNPAQLPATSGNFIYVRWRGSRPELVCCGAVDDLTSAYQFWDAAVRAYGVEGLYIRLNVSRAIRDSENDEPTMALCAPMPARVET